MEAFSLSNPGSIVAFALQLARVIDPPQVATLGGLFILVGMLVTGMHSVFRNSM